VLNLKKDALAQIVMEILFFFEFKKKRKSKISIPLTKKHGN
jgi:hypothetical protein